MRRPHRSRSTGILCALAFVAACVVGSCNQKPTGADSYQFERKEFTHTAPAISFVVHPNQQALVAAAPAATRDAVKAQGRELMAWSILRGPGNNQCIVHIVDPAVRYAPEWIGHEITHCVYGRWHA